MEQGRTTDSGATQAPTWLSRLPVPAARQVALAVALAAIVGVALALRLYGVDWDRGYSYTPHPDERAILMKVGELRPPGLGELGLLFDPDLSPWNPRWFPYGSFPLYLLKAVQLGYSEFTGSGLHDLRTAGRVISTLADVAAVVLVYLLGSRMYGRRDGLLASALVALTVLHIQLSHFYAVDTILGLCTLGALYFLFRVAGEGRLRDSLFAGAFIGLGVATKVSFGPIYLVFVTAHVLFAISYLRISGRARAEEGATDESDAPRLEESAASSATTDVASRVGGDDERWRLAVRGLAAGVAVSVVVFLVVQPYALLDAERFLSDVTEQSEMVRRIRDYPYTRQYVDTTPYLYQIRQSVTWGLGWPLGLVAWLGLLYVALRGLRPRVAAGYLVLGWVLPAALLLWTTSFFAIALASITAVAAILATLPFRGPGARADVLLLSWVAPYLLITGAFEVKFIRYLLPITPVLVLLGSRMVFALWDAVSERRRGLRPWVAGGIAALVGATGLYALAYSAVYAQPHTAVRSANWINANSEPGALVLKEHWEEAIPGLVGHKVRELPMYEADTEAKIGYISDELAEADYVVFFSNRLYGTIPRIPEMYPVSGTYYRLLFSGKLGYELASVESAYPRLPGVSFTDDTFGRPDVPRPPGIGTGEGLEISLGFADESFSVYDHPLGLVFSNTERLDAETIRGRIENAAGPEARSQRLPGGGKVGLLLSPALAREQREGGTWSEIVRPGSWGNRYPVLVWLLLIEGIGLLALPIALVLFRPLPDRGFLFSKALGILLVVFGAWMLASLRWAPFSRESIGISALVVALLSAVILVTRRRELAGFVRQQWRVMVVGEALFLAAFFAFVMLRMANPDLWHPYLGGEKPMDFAYLNGVLRSSYMPPYDPWFGGGYLNYYYWGQLIVATLIRATSIDPAVAFNLAVPTFFALTAAGAFAIVYNLAEGTRRGSWTPGSGDRGQPQSPTPDPQPLLSFSWSPLLAGLGGASFVTVLGNLDGGAQVVQGFWRVFVSGVPFGQFDFWRSSRMMAPGNEITEFPFFTFLFADLHAHLMAIPFTLLALGLALAIVIGASRGQGQKTSVPSPSGGRLGRGFSEYRLGEFARLGALGLVIGALRLINTWDYPTYLVVGAGAVFLAEYFRNGGLSLAVLVASALKAALVFAVGYAAFLPFHLSYESFFTSIESTTNQTVLWQFLGITGLFLFIIVSYFAAESRDRLLPLWQFVKRELRDLTGVGAEGRTQALAAREAERVRALRTWALMALAALAGYLAFVVVSGWVGSNIPFVIGMLALVVGTGIRFLKSRRPDRIYLAFVTLIVAVSLMLVAGLDGFRVDGDIDRMNSVFKFYLQVWVMLALAAAYLLWRLVHRGWFSWATAGLAGKVWAVALAVLILGASVYPVLGTRARLNNRFAVLPPTLDGMAYMKESDYRDANGIIDLSADYDGIKWLQGSTNGSPNVQGSPIILEGVTPIYRWGSRVSVYTGLPSIVGWPWHQAQQRWGYRSAVDRRISDVNRIYTTTDSEEALALLRRYDVGYVYLGQLERLYYPDEGLRKFDEGLAELLVPVYQNGHVTIYRVREG